MFLQDIYIYIYIYAYICISNSYRMMLPNEGKLQKGERVIENQPLPAWQEDLEDCQPDSRQRHRGHRH